MIDESTDFGARAARRLREEIVVWLTTVTPGGAPLPRPVWFVWDGADTVRMHSLDGARVRNLHANPRVTLNFNSTPQGGDVIVLSGTAAIDESAPAADRDEPYVAKYGDDMARVAGSLEGFAARYSVPVRIDVAKVDGH